MYALKFSSFGLKLEPDPPGAGEVSGQPVVSVGTSRDDPGRSIYIKEDDLCDQVAEMAPVSHFNNLRNSSNVSRMQERSQL